MATEKGLDGYWRWNYIAGEPSGRDKIIARGLESRAKKLQELGGIGARVVITNQSHRGIYRIIGITMDNFAKLRKENPGSLTDQIAELRPTALEKADEQK